MKHIFFSKVFRQTEEAFIRKLDIVRVGKEPELYEALQYFIRRVVDERPERVLALCAKRKDAEAVNMEQLKKLPGVEYLVLACIREGPEKYWSRKQHAPAPPVLKIKKGSL